MTFIMLTIIILIDTITHFNNDLQTYYYEHDKIGPSFTASLDTININIKSHNNDDMINLNNIQ